MVKTYLRYAPQRSFAVINSPECNVVVGGQGAFAVCGALNDVVVWHLRRGSKVRCCNDSLCSDVPAPLCIPSPAVSWFAAEDIHN